ncbi:Protein OS-9, partial [Kickxella alabastrina]
MGAFAELVRLGGLFSAYVLLLLSSHAGGPASTALGAETNGHMRGLLSKDITRDMLESPRFQIKMLSALIPESKLPATISQLRAKASERPQGVGADTVGDELIVDPVALRVGRQLTYLCRVPRVGSDRVAAEAAEAAAAAARAAALATEEQRQGGTGTEEAEDALTVRRGLELLGSLESQCISLTIGFWTYEYCHGQHVRQLFHQEADSSGTMHVLEYFLGDHRHRKPFPDLLPNGAEAAPSMGERRLGEERQVGGQLTKVIRTGRKRFLTQVWGGGTLCDITGQPRQVEVQFHCDPNGPERISLADEVAICRYVLMVNTPRLCADPRFYDTQESAAYDILCQHVVPDEEYEEMLREAKGKEDRRAMLLDRSFDADKERGGRHGFEDEYDDYGFGEDDFDAGLADAAAASGRGRGRAEKQPKQPNQPTEPNQPKHLRQPSEDAPQVVISLSDPRLARAPRESREILRSMLALMYGDNDLRVKFADPNEPSRPSEPFGPSEPSEPSEQAADKGGQTLKQVEKKAAAGVTVSVVDKEETAENLESNDKDEQPRAHDE